DDLYRIEIFGTDDPNLGITALRDQSLLSYSVTNDTTDDGFNQDTIYFELDLGAQVVSVVPQPVSRARDVSLTGSPTGGQFQLTFNGEMTALGAIPIDVTGKASAAVVQTALENLSAINPGEVVVTGNGPWKIAFQGRYAGEQVSLVGNGTLLTGGANPSVKVGIGALSQARNQIVVFFNDDKLYESMVTTTGTNDPSVVDPAFYQLIFTNETVRNTDDIAHNPVSVTYDPAINKAVLTFADDIAKLDGSGVYRLRVGTKEILPPPPASVIVASDPGSSFTTANNLGPLGSQEQILSSAIDPESFPYAFPGDQNEPGHRDIPFDAHLNGGADAQDGTATIFYNFRSDYGSANGIPLQNAITEEQKHLTRQIFDLFSSYLGVRFVESAASGLTIVTGDLRAVDPTVITGPGGIAGIAGGGTAVMDAAENWDDRFGGSWFNVAMHEIGHLLGQGHTYDLPPLTIQGSLSSADAPALSASGEAVFPGNNDIVHGQHLFRPDSTDIDVYRFTIDVPANKTGLFTAETLAERQGDSSLLNTTLRLYREITDQAGAVIGQELIAQNDDYFSEDSYIEVELGAGTYYIGVSASGNDQYDPSIEDSGLGGRSQGAYDLHLNFRPDTDTSIVDTSGTALDGDADGTPGGVYNFWFQTQALNRKLDIVANGSAFANGRVLTITNSQGAIRRFEFRTSGSASAGNIQINVLPGDTGTDVATKLASAITLVAGFNVLASAVGSEIELSGERNVLLSSGTLEIELHGKTIFVDKSAATTGSNGSLSQPFNNISRTNAINAFSNAHDGDIVRIVGNGGVDGDATTLGDNQAYEIGFGGPLGTTLSDGATMSVPKGVTTMIDAGAVFKLRRARIGVGSSTASVNRSGGALQVLGTPSQNVIFTSYNDESVGIDTNSVPTTASAGDWGGISFRKDVDRNEGRFGLERQGIFLNYINHSDIRYGGGNVSIDSVLQVVNSIHVTESRPTITFNTIRDGADAAISADPNSFEETNFRAPLYQLSGAFTSDYSRIGPDIHGNRLENNSTNALFVRITTTATEEAKALTVAGRFDDTDIVHVISENLVIQGTAGGPIQEQSRPDISLVAFTPAAAGSLIATNYSYRVTFVDANGNEGLPSLATAPIAVPGSPGQGTLILNNLPSATGDFVSRRIYRSDVTAGSPFVLVANIDASTATYVDDGTVLGGNLIIPVTLLRPRLNARLAIDPGMIIKLEGARIETVDGAQFIAEGREGAEIVFTSRLDDRYGASGTYDTNNDDGKGANEDLPRGGDWGGIFTGHGSSVSIDHTLITFGGGINKIEGEFAGFNVIEIHQADARIAHSVIENNASGVGGQAPSHRFGRGSNTAAAIFVRGAQPILVDNIIRDNFGSGATAAISINVNALNNHLVTDDGRSTGPIEAEAVGGDNRGPLIRENRLSQNGVNGVVIRGEILTTESIWDDTDIVHVVNSEITVPDFHTYGGLRLASSPTESLVVKLSGGNAGFTATGRPLDIDDRIGGRIHILGQPGFPVVLTSLFDSSVGAGFEPSGVPQTNTANSASQPQPGDWRSITLDQFSHDRNVEIILEQEASDVVAPGLNSNPDVAQFLGALAVNEKSSDETRRLGFEIHGFLTEASDLDVYSFEASAGTEVWLDIDRTTQALDAVVELIDSLGNVIARSDNSVDESAGTPLFVADPVVQANRLDKSPFVSDDRWTLNPLDAGMRVVLPGAGGQRGTYHVRVRSSSPNLDVLDGGLTHGVYQLQIRLGELDEFPGSTVRYAAIRYAQNGIELFGLPAHSPLLGEAAEYTNAGAINNNTLADANDLGNILNSDRAALSVAGVLATANDVDWYRFEVAYDATQGTQDTTHFPLVFDIDYADGLSRANTSLWVFDAAGNLILNGRDSNVADDRPGPNQGADLDDLNRGSVGPLDPFIGPTELPASEAAPVVYYVAVSSNARIPAEMDQFLVPLATNPLLRVEPVNSLQRIAEDQVSTTNRSQLAIGPQVDLFDNSSFVPFNLNDVNLFVSQDGGGNVSRLLIVNPFTGATTNTVGVSQANFEDIALNPSEGLFYGFSSFEGNANDANTGNYHRIDPRSVNGTVLSTNLGDDGIVTSNDDPMNPGTAIVSDVGVHFDALTIGEDGTPGLAGYAVGSRAANNGVNLTRNLLYEFDVATGAGITNGNGARPANTGAWTSVIERASLDTFSDPFTTTGRNVLLVEEATIVDAAGNATFNITDAQGFGPDQGQIAFTIDDGSGTTFDFEFNSGPEVRYIHNLASGRTIRDGDQFTLDSGLPTERIYEFDTGPLLVSTANGNQVLDGQTFTLTDNGLLDPMNPQVITRTFEFDRQGGLNNSNAIPINFATGDNANQIIQAVVNAINGPAAFNIQATAQGSRITLVNDSFTVAPIENVAGGFFVLQGASNVTAGTFRIPAEETFDDGQFGAAMDIAINGAPHDASRDGDRINFRGALTADFSGSSDAGITNPIFTQSGSDGTVTPGFIGVGFNAADDGVTIAVRIVNAINAASIGVTATAVGAGVQLGGFFPFFATADAPLAVGGTAPGGDITGMAFINNALYAVTADDPTVPGIQGGGLYRIFSPTSNFAIADYINTSTDLLGIQFAGLSAGPRNVEGGRFANLLFGIDTGGRLYAFDRLGELQPIFVDGQTSIQTGVGFGIQGLAFSNLDVNLWHTTANRQGDPGHGTNLAFDGSRTAEGNNSSFYFGFESRNANGLSNTINTTPSNVNNYDFPGGAQGALISNPFSLEGYSADDRPTLYFNYYLETENANADLNVVALMRDAFRVYASGSDGNWQLISTNNSDRGGGFADDEFDQNSNSQETFDVGDFGAQNSWRQVRIPLEAFAGQDNLRLRFEFSTAGDYDLGDAGTTGDELRALEASLLRDGQSFLLTNAGNFGTTTRFELDFGYTLVAPTGAGIEEGDSFTLDGATYEFDNDGFIFQ
ncbi:MAG: pre-peptidase C-terminal domain-containing protein, partial [Planctomycetota bacterium]|nr:pre-peptidase C-terminal domain-containing protein [Planctomycetota bacterium]